MCNWLITFYPEWMLLSYPEQCRDFITPSLHLFFYTFYATDVDSSYACIFLWYWGLNSRPLRVMYRGQWVPRGHRVATVSTTHYEKYYKTSRASNVHCVVPTFFSLSLIWLLHEILTNFAFYTKSYFPQELFFISPGINDITHSVYHHGIHFKPLLETFCAFLV
jgi:hypothetical protein